MPHPRDPHIPGDSSPYAVDRRRFVGYVLGGATLVAAADLVLADTSPAAAEIPTAPQPAELYDLNDMLTDAARPTANLVTVTINEDGTASFELPRAEVGQGITTSTAMLIAEELDLPVDRVRVTLAPARPELLFNQLTGGSNTTIATYTPIRVAAAVARAALLDAAAIVLGDTVAGLVAKGGVITARNGSSVTYGELAVKAAGSAGGRAVQVELKSEAEFSVIGTPTNRVDALAAVTGQKDFTTDLDVPDALPTMVCRAPTLNGTPVSVRNQTQVEAMPGVTHVAQVSTGVAVRAATFGQCIDAVRALEVAWKDGPVAGESDATILRKVRAAQLPMPRLPDTPLAQTVSGDFTFWFRSNSPMDTNSAVADVRPDGATIWAGLKSPIVAQQRIAEKLGMSQDKVKVNVVTAGGSFGRRLFFDGALEAAEISQAMGAPVKLMWHRADDARVGRTHPMGTCRVQATVLGTNVLAFNQSLTCVETDFRHGLGEIITAAAADLPAGVGNLGFAETIFALTQEVPYDFGAVTQTLVETDDRFNTGSMRNIYSPDVRVASELVVDKLAAKMRMDPYQFRRKFQRNERLLAVLDTVAQAGEWGRPMPAGTAQGIAIHKEYKGVSACLVEIDTRPATTGRQVRDAVTGPRVTRVTFAIDVGLAINPRGLEAQMQGGINDGIALALTSSLHLRDGHFLEASWDNYFYTRQWNTPPDVRVIVVPSEEKVPGGAGEAGVAATFAAVACAYARATGTMPTQFPINHDQLSFEPKSFVPPIPQSPVNGLELTS
ncbi:isoquinoline 1-oxidoreductase beta subunit [Nocardioides sp. BE266]|uniref:molybdopterin cofactor-binding domain-containing protein n=1 Tax=Nocardioides sp. BE266 TaxID=2817725 RepID=UPI0028563702|nr:molybdopterin cofactor-binding domain-containing protein [Nocardioides sp. BE266]MDR7252024.1 isoquinoline 1-oxidoreductase beta subunit [Nocardioides sp. BE266]